MNNLKRQLRWLWISLAVIVLVNLAAVAFFMFGKKNHRTNGRGIGDRLEVALELTPQQISQFEELREEHFSKTHHYRERIHELKTELFSNLVQSEEKTNKLTSEIGALEAKCDQLTFRHFQKFRALLDEDQKTKLDEVLPRFLERHPPGPPHRKPPRNVKPSKFGSKDDI